MGPAYLLTLQVKLLLKHPANQKLLLGWRRTSLESEGLAISAEASNTMLTWAAFQKIAATRDHGFFYTTPQHAVIVPRRPFVSDEEFREFVALARRYRDVARQLESADRSPDREPPEVDTNINQGEHSDH